VEGRRSRWIELRSRSRGFAFNGMVRPLSANRVECSESVFGLERLWTCHIETKAT